MSTEPFGVNTKKHVWLVSELFYPETISTGYIMTEIATALAKDYQVSVVCGPEFYEEKDEKVAVEQLPNVNIHRIQSKGYNKNSFISRIIGHFKVTYKMLRLMKKKIPKCAKILMVTNPVLLLVLTSFVAKKNNWKINVLVHDVFPENVLISGFLKSKTSFLFGIMKRIFNNAFKKMDVLIVLGRDMQKLFEQKKGNKEGITIIENWADTENITARPISETSKKKLLFAGNMGRLQGLEVLLEALKRTENNPYTFTFIGSGALENYIEEFIVAKKTTHIEKHGWIPREEQDKFMADATIGVVTLKKDMYGLGVPSKFYKSFSSRKTYFLYWRCKLGSPFSIKNA
jgi:glycosyltransferase involved in cell wall biosynthesis